VLKHNSSHFGKTPQGRELFRSASLIATVKFTARAKWPVKPELFERYAQTHTQLAQK
jgi:hypothetical protein